MIGNLTEIKTLYLTAIKTLFMRLFGHLQTEMLFSTTKKAMQYLLPLFLAMRSKNGNKHIFWDGLNMIHIFFSWKYTSSIAIHSLAHAYNC